MKDKLRRLWPRCSSSGSTGKLIGSDNAKLEQAKALVLQGNALEEKSLAEAAFLYRQAIALVPEFPQGYLNLGIVLAASGDRKGAMDAYSKALALDSSNAFVYYNMGCLAYDGQKYEEADGLLCRALDIKPVFPEALVMWANTLEALGRDNEALEALGSALQQNPALQGASYNKALLLIKLSRYEDAEEEVRRFLDKNPDHLPAVQMLAISLWGQGLYSESLQIYKSLREIDPNSLELMSREAFLSNYDFNIQSVEIYEYHRNFGNNLEEIYPAFFSEFKGNQVVGRKLRIGYLSGDFSFHPVALFILPVVERHHRQDFEVYCYYTSDKVDQITVKMRSMADRWVDASSLSYYELAERIYSDKIDVLVDLVGHTSGSKLPVFALRPAPVQVSWMGYLNTTGLSRIHYRICDERTDPSGISDALHTESLVRMPNSQWCYRPFISVPSAQVAPFEKKGYITFGCFNHAMKISPEICGLWREILLSVSNSRLLCVGLSSTRKMSELIWELTRSGVEGERLEFVARASLDQYYGWFSEADIALDTYPYGGGTTTFDTLWMGVPVVAAKGTTSTSRSAASILEALGLEEWVAPTINDYVRVAVERAMDIKRVVELRKSLRGLLQSSPLMDEEKFVNDLESAYRTMWHEYCDKTGPFQDIQ